MLLAGQMQTARDRKDAGLCCGSRLRKGEVFAYVGRIHNLKDRKDDVRAPQQMQPLEAKDGGAR